MLWVVFIFILNASGFFLLLNRMLLHRVAAVFPIHLLPYITAHIFGMVISALDSDLGDLVRCYAAISLSEYWGAVLSCVEFYMHNPGSCSPTCIRLETNAGSSTLMLRAHIYGDRSLVRLWNSVLSADVPSVYLGELFFSPVEMLPRHVPMSCKHMS